MIVTLVLNSALRQSDQVDRAKLATWVWSGSASEYASKSALDQAEHHLGFLGTDLARCRFEPTSGSIQQAVTMGKLPTLAANGDASTQSWIGQVRHSALTVTLALTTQHIMSSRSNLTAVALLERAKSSAVLLC